MADSNATPFEADLRQGVTPAAHLVLDRVDETRDSLAGSDLASIFSMACRSADSTRGGDLQSRRSRAITAAAFLIVAVEQIDAELAG
jgi:hypothetical protein